LLPQPVAVVPPAPEEKVEPPPAAAPVADVAQEVAVPPAPHHWNPGEWLSAAAIEAVLEVLRAERQARSD
jgi:hypothetical protein